MSWKTWTTVAGSIAMLVVGCGPDETGTTNGEEETQEATIESFNVEPATVTSGEDVEGEMAQGTATVAWETSNAGTISLTKDVGDSQVDLENCEPAEGAEDCTAGGSLEVEPAEATTYTLTAAPSESTECGVDSAACAEAEIEVDVAEPALLSFDRDGQEFVPGEAFEVDYSVEHADEWTIGAWDGEEMTACRLPEEDGDAPCVLEGESGEPASSGTLTVEARSSQITLTGRASNGAGDNLGSLAPGDVTMAFTPAGTPMIDSFEPSQSNAGVGDTVTLSWETVESTGVTLTSPFETGIDTDLGSCATIDDQGAGSCEVEFTEEAAGTEIVFELVATYSGGGVEVESDTASASVNVGQAATVDTFVADPTMLPEGGGETTLSWATNDASSLTIADGDGNTILDTANDEGVGQCRSGGSGCNLDADSISVSVGANETFTLTAENQFGSAAEDVQVTIEAAPQITLAEVEGTDVTSNPAIVDKSSGTLEWDTMEADSTTLERGSYPSAGCDSQDVSWSEVSGFGGGTSGTYDLSGLDSARQCFRLTAVGGADQTATVAFNVVREPKADSFDVQPDAVTTGDTVDLTWATQYAVGVDATVSPKGAVTSDDLDDCTSVDSNGEGQCTVTVQPGTPEGDVTFTLTALGGADTTSGSLDSVTTIGTAPSIPTFDSPESAAEGDDVDLTWETTDATNVVIEDDAGNTVCSYNSPNNGSTNTCTASNVTETTTWTLTASNNYGEKTRQTTTFVGPRVESFTITGPNGTTEDALAGNVTLDTGDMVFDWTTGSTDSVDLADADVPASGNCDDASFTDFATGLNADGSRTVGDVVANTCYRLTANGANASSSVIVKLSDLPFDTDIAVDPNSVDRQSPQTINVDMDVTGAETMTLRARYLDGNQVVEVRKVCDETTLDGGNLSHNDTTPTLDEVRCQHDHDDYICTAGQATPGQNSIPRNANTIEYQLTYTDPEGEQRTSSSADYGENVAVGDEANFCGMP